MMSGGKRRIPDSRLNFQRQLFSDFDPDPLMIVFFYFADTGIFCILNISRFFFLCLLSVCVCLHGNSL